MLLAPVISEMESVNREPAQAFYNRQVKVNDPVKKLFNE